MTNVVYYNDNDPFVCEWLRCLIKKGLLPDGPVDSRSIVDVVPSDLGSFRQCHFFAGIGGWARALELAQWPEERECWTASLPCQPLSVAGARQGALDGRHLWPAFYRLVAVCCPPTIFGEQVASKDGREWLAGVRIDLEDAGYACGAANLPACAVGAPHRRERLFWGALANPNGSGQSAQREHDGEVRRLQEAQRQPEHGSALFGRSGDDGGAVADADRGRLQVERDAQLPELPSGNIADRCSQPMADAKQPRERWRSLSESREGAAAEGSWPPTEPRGTDSDGGVGDAEHTDQGRETPQRHAGRDGAAYGADFWDDAEWRVGADGKSRRVKPGVRLLAHGVPNRVGALRGFGNAITPQVAAEFVLAFLAATSPTTP